jgi:hypothetical protein
MEWVQRCAVLVAAIALIVGFYKLTIWRADSVVRQWALENGFELLHFKRCFFKGGFGWSPTSQNQIVYSVCVRDRWNEERSGWLRCGNYFGVIFSNEAQVKWKESPRDTSTRA